MGAKGWVHRHVLPYFKRLENSHGGEEGWRGTNGPMHVKRGRRLNPLYQAFVCLLYTSPSPRDRTRSRMPSSA